LNHPIGFSHLKLAKVSLGAVLAAWVLNVAIPGTTAFAQIDLSTNKLFTLPVSRNGLFLESDIITLSNADASAVQVSTLDGTIVYEGPPTALQLTRGHYFVETTDDKTQFAVLPGDYHGAPSFGVEAEWNSSGLQTLQEIQPGWSRALSSGNTWLEAEPQRGVWDWDTLDRNVDLCYQNGAKLILTAWLRPTWLTNDDEFIPLYCEYLRQLCSRYGDKLYAIEIWNEPNSRARWPDSPSEWLPFENSAAEVPAAYINVLSNAYFTIKGVNPNIKVYGAGWTTPITEDFIEEFAALGGQSYLDGFTFHDYYMRVSPPDQATLLSDGLRPRIDQIVAKYRSLFGSRDLFMNEGAFYGQSALGIPNTSANTNTITLSSDLSWYRGMNRAVKMMVMYRAGGVLGVVPHVIIESGTDTNNNVEIFGWEFNGRGPHPKVSAALMTSYWLQNASFVDYRIPGSNVFLYAWQRPDNTSLLVAWALEGQSVPLVASGLPSATDIFGRPVAVTALSEEPVLFFSSSPDALELLRTVRSKIATVTNLAPVFDSLPTQSVIAGQTLQFTISATDPDNDPITYSAAQLPSGATFDPNARTFSWTPTTGASGPYDITFVATDDQGASTSNTVTVTVAGSVFDGLIAHWKLDEVSGTTAADSAGTNNGTLVNFDFTPTSPWGRAHKDRGLAFDGVKDYVGIDGNQLYLTNGFTVVTWIKPQNAMVHGAFLSVRSSFKNSGFRFFVYENSLELEGQTTAGWQYTSFADNAISNGVWYHVAVAYDQSKLTVYLNGVARGSADWGGDFIMDPTATNNRIGDEGGYYFDGVIDNLMIFGRPLTAFQIQTLYRPNNSAPVLRRVKNKRVHAGRRIRIKLKARDRDHDALTYSIYPLPAGAVLNRRTLVWRPLPYQIGQYDLTATVSDGCLTSSRQFTITVH